MRPGLCEEGVIEGGQAIGCVVGNEWSNGVQPLSAELDREKRGQEIASASVTVARVSRIERSAGQERYGEK